jgi:hypothetical protein
MGAKYWEVMSNQRNIGGSGEYCGDYDAPFGCINVLYHEALGGKCDAEHIVCHTLG